MRTSQDLADLNLPKWWKSWKSSQCNHGRSLLDYWWDFWDNWFVLVFMSANVKGRFEYETCFCKICSLVVGRGSKKQSFEFLLQFKGTSWKWPQILSKVVTGDETWHYGYDPEIKQASSQWKTPNSPKRKRPNRFDQMFSKTKEAQQVWSNVNMLNSFFDANGIVHKEFVPPGQTVNEQLYLKVLKTYAIVYGKNNQKCGAAVIGSFTTTMPLPTQPWVCSSFWQKTTWWLDLILPIHTTLRHVTFSCSLIWKAGWKGNVLLMSAKWKSKCRRAWTTSALKSSRNVFSSGKNIGINVSSQK